MEFFYAVSEAFNVLKEVLIIDETFIGIDKKARVLSNNIFYSVGFSATLEQATALKNGAVIFGYPVYNPTGLGVIDFDKTWKVLSLEEKSRKPNLIIQCWDFISMIIKW